MIFQLVLLAVFGFIQNMAFTWTSRSRNSGDPSYHRYAAWCSNGIWLITNLTALTVLLDPVKNGDWLTALPAGLVYIIFTTEGSVFMMRILLGKIHVPMLSKWLTEKGERKVGHKYGT